MASANEPGLIRVVCERADGLQKVAMQYRSDSAVNAGKSPDGVLANLTVDKQMKVGYVNPVLTAGDKVHLFFKFDAADGLDVSDGVVQIPYWEDGNYRPLTSADLGNTTDIPAATPASAWIELGTGYTVPSNVKSARLGNGTIVISIEDDT
jgi:hypothetical protein